MRLKFRNFIAASMVAIAALTVSCGLDDVDFTNPDDSNDSTEDLGDGIGYLSLSSLGLVVDNESEDFMTTKAADDTINTDNYFISIINEDESSEQAPILMSYADIKALGSGELELEAGYYILSARSYEETIAALGWDSPEYASIDYSFVIKEGETSEFSDSVICTLANIMATVNLSDELLAKFDSEDTDSPLTLTLQLGEVVATFSLNESGELVGAGGEVAYFATQVDDNSMTLTTTGMYNTALDGDTPTYKYIEWVEQIENVAAGQYRNITISLSTENGNTNIEVTILSSVGNQNITVDLTDGDGEAELDTEETPEVNPEPEIDPEVDPDPEIPTEPEVDPEPEVDTVTCTLTWRDGYDFATRYDISENIALPVVIDMTSETGITKLTIDIESDALTPELLAEMYLAQHMDLINPETAEMEEMLKSLGFPTGDDIDGQTLLVFDITKFMPMLAMVAEVGDETDFKITLGDASGEVTETILVKVVE
ncbi:MAG: DUF4493 domain-containing protein [Rikenellaceae bacterium]